MANEYLQLGATAIVAISAFKAIEYVVRTLKPKKEGKEGHPLCANVITLQALFQAHEDSQREAFATVHNGLNTNANAIKDITKALADNTVAVEKLRTIIDERIPKKQ